MKPIRNSRKSFITIKFIIWCQKPVTHFCCPLLKRNGTRKKLYHKKTRSYKRSCTDTDVEDFVKTCTAVFLFHLCVGSPK